MRYFVTFCLMFFSVHVEASRCDDYIKRATDDNAYAVTLYFAGICLKKVDNMKANVFFLKSYEKGYEDAGRELVMSYLTNDNEQKWVEAKHIIRTIAPDDRIGYFWEGFSIMMTANNSKDLEESIVFYKKSFERGFKYSSFFIMSYYCQIEDKEGCNKWKHELELATEVDGDSLESVISKMKLSNPLYIRGEDKIASILMR
ncbi:hypothetical protein [Amphritea pacifica]|uniref:hypothetical protein n=1 Tax=Amphritea pacifica TaxID=2811233 RepID=UPI0019622FD5|nr:hypothetical protein [Amphritea pacifica]MBN1008176.1 hypothetical protein [Amphritea pacifica]